jgi:hypothetical protein
MRGVYEQRACERDDVDIGQKPTGVILALRRAASPLAHSYPAKNRKTTYGIQDNEKDNVT